MTDKCGETDETNTLCLVMCLRAESVVINSIGMNFFTEMGLFFMTLQMGQNLLKHFFCFNVLLGRSGIMVEMCCFRWTKCSGINC